MFILQTTTAILIAFLALLAWSEIRNRLAKGRSSKKDLECPASPGISVTNEKSIKPTVEAKHVPASSVDVSDGEVNDELAHYKQLYYRLHNLENHPDILPQCRAFLLGSLSSTLSEALKEPSGGILTVPTFSREALSKFLKAKDVDCTDRWEQYIARRKAGGSREMFGDVSEAQWWLKQAAPVKYVDGAWLGHINKITTPFRYRHIAKNAWQVMSEELGDGDLAKNHVQVYRDLMEDIDAGLPAADSQDFIHSRHELTEVRCWRAALAQLTISLFPHEFLAEVLGFNMAYESLPLHLLKTVKELRELRLNPYYFELHISIDNADSGHAAMAMAAVADYIDIVERTHGSDAAHVAWKRVQAGYLLAEGLPTTPESPSLKKEPEIPFPRDETEKKVLDVFAAKSFVAHKIHCNSRLKIGRRSLVDWLEPNAFEDADWQKEFLHDLGNCKPWVVKGDSAKSKLIKELSWEGKMFGSFTEKEVKIVESWINALGKQPQAPVPDPKVYFDFIWNSSSPSKNIVSEHMNIFKDYPVFTDMSFEPDMPVFHLADESLNDLDLTRINVRNLLSLWFTSPTLLEALPNVPVRAADDFGSALVRVLRAQAGFNIEGSGVAGMDEVNRTDRGGSLGIVEFGLEICRHAGLAEPSSLQEAMLLGDTSSVKMCEWMVHASMRWLAHRDMLIGMSWVFMQLHHQVAHLDGDDALLDSNKRQRIERIAARERLGLEVCRGEIGRDPQRARNYAKGTTLAKHAIASCFIS